jgi:hypothetical protein
VRAAGREGKEGLGHKAHFRVAGCPRRHEAFFWRRGLAGLRKPAATLILNGARHRIFLAWIYLPHISLGWKEDEAKKKDRLLKPVNLHASFSVWTFFFLAKTLEPVKKFRGQPRYEPPISIVEVSKVFLQYGQRARDSSLQHISPINSPE